MKLPDEIKVGAHRLKVIFPYRFTERSDLHAQCDMLASEIRICDVDGGGQEISPQQVEASFMHEIFHAVDHVYNATQIDEDTTKRLSQGLYQVLRDNFNLMLVEEKLNDPTHSLR